MGCRNLFQMRLRMNIARCLACFLYPDENNNLLTDGQEGCEYIE